MGNLSSGIILLMPRTYIYKRIISQLNLPADSRFSVVDGNENSFRLYVGNYSVDVNYNTYGYNAVAHRSKYHDRTISGLLIMPRLPNKVKKLLGKYVA